MSVTHTHIDEDCVLDIKPQQATSLQVSIPIFNGHEEAGSFFPRRAFGSASTSGSDPFSEVLPWTALFESRIWSPCKESNSFPTDAASSSSTDSADDISTFSMIESVDTEQPTWLASVLDPTSLAFHFDDSCLDGLDDELLHNPRGSFAALCWESVIPKTSTVAPKSAPIVSKPQQVLEPVEPYLPQHRTSFVSFDSSAESPIPIFLTPSLWSEDTDGSDSDDSYDDDCYSNGTTTGGRLVLEKKRDLYDYEADEEIKNTPFQLEPHYTLANHDNSKSVGHFPTPVIRRNKTVSGRLVAFCSTIPTRLTLVRSGSFMQ